MLFKNLIILSSKVHPQAPRRLFGPLSGFEGPLPGPSAPVLAPFRCRRSIRRTLSVLFGPFPASKVHSLDPQCPFRPLSAVEGPSAGPSAPVWAPFRLRRSTSWTLSACFSIFPASKVHPQDPRRPFQSLSAVEGPSAGPSAPVWSPFRLSKVHSLDPQRPFRPLSGVEGPLPGPSAPEEGAYRSQWSWRARAGVGGRPTRTIQLPRR